MTGTLTTLATRYADAPPRGEIVIVIAPPGDAPPASAEDADTALADALTRLSTGQAASEVAKALGLDRKTLYARALELKAKGDPPAPRPSRRRTASTADRQVAEAAGRRGERLAGWWLRLKGWSILDRRVRRLRARSTSSRARGRWSRSSR